ncbi:HYR domain-containing protein [Nocardioides sp.]|uniref:HYR domain-containing protein n=1 Tax=Nocardioides sp. TaxID=35761 RepID=UPI002F4227B9
MAFPAVAPADTVYNNLDGSIDAMAESLALTAGGATGSTSLFVTPANGDGVNGCNVKNTAALTVNVVSSNTSVATVSPTSVTFESCGTGQPVTVTPKAKGTATITLSTKSNATGGTFDYAPATFIVNVSAPANTAPSVTLNGVTNGASYEYGNVPKATCSVIDKEDGASSFDAAVSAVSGPRAADGLGSQTATCSYTDQGDSTGQNQLADTKTATYSIVDTTKPLVTATAPGSTEATGALTSVLFSASATDAVDGSLPVICSTAGGKAYASGDGFPVGTTTLTCSATDKAGNKGSADPINVVVNDTTAPTLTTSANVVVGNDSSTGATVKYDAATATDLVDGTVAAICSPASGTKFALGDTTVSCSATDTAGNTASVSFTVTVQDKTAPVVTVPQNIVAEATGPNGADVDYGSVTATDDVDGTLPTSCDVSSGKFALGTTKVTCSATDKAGNSSDNSFTVTVQDTTAPEVTVPSTVLKEATSADGASASFAVSATDLVDGSITPDCTATSGSTFALGETEVVCTAKDKAGNEGTGSFTVKVVDTTPPAVTVPADVTAEATDATGAKVLYGEVSAKDIVDGSIEPTCDLSSGAVFPLGATKVTCSAQDSSGNEGTSSFTVNVVDTTAPVVQTSPNVQAGNDLGAKGASAVSYAPAMATDVVDGIVATTCSPASGSAFPMGITTVTCTATDKAGNQGSAKFTIEVQDVNKPVVHVPSAMTAEATGPTGAKVSWNAAEVYGEDDVDGTLPATCDQVNGSVFPLGSTTVTCSATDKSGNKGDNTFTITVRDTTAPIVAVSADKTAVATSASGASVTYTAPTANDIVDGTVAAACDKASGSVFPLGTTTVTCTATDKAGNTDTKTFKVTVTAAWSNILQPVNLDGSSIFKLGSTVPVKFALTGASAGISDLQARLFLQRIGAGATGTVIEAISTSNATTGNLFRYDPTSAQYLFNLNTKPLSAGTYQLRVDLGDGVLHTVNISLK